MKFVKTYKYKLKPNKTQEKTIIEWLGICRYLYNNALEHRITAYQSNGTSISKYDQYNELPAIKKDLPFIKKVYSDTLQEVLDRIDNSFQRFFSGAGFPKFRNKHNYNSFTFKRNYKVTEDYIQLPKIGKVAYFNSRSIPENGTPKYASIIRKYDGYYICISVEFDIPEPSIDDSQAIGIDAGVKHFATLSNDTHIDSPYFLEPCLKKLRKLQRKLSRQQKGSNSREKTKKQISKLHLKIKRRRQDFLHKKSTKLANWFSSCYVENLKISNMTKLNSTLSRRMLDNGFRTFRNMLDYKFKEQGKHFLAVPPQYTSQKCNSCGCVDSKSRASQSEFVCTSCGHISNADINAAKNILASGRSLSAKRKPLG